VTVWAWADTDLEVVGDAADLGEQLGVPVHAVLAGSGVDPEAAAEVGADRVVALDADPLDSEAQAAALAACLGDAAPAAVLLPGTAAGSELAGRLAGRMGLWCLADCAQVRPDREGRGLEVARWAFDDRAHERWLVPAGIPLVATLRPGSRGAPRPRPRPLQLDRRTAPAGRARSRRRLPPDPASVRLAEADRIVAAGLGVGSREGLPEVERLAGLLHAAVGGSRPLADRGWLPFERQIGVTGQIVSPRLYLAIGISGAPQHVGGLRDIETLVAINTDAACPMMTRADLAIAGDAAEVLRALSALLDHRGAARAPAGGSP
jgi:electron transfer flavoprotein alpha subunit